MKATFTEHGQLRASQRLTLDAQKIIELLDSERTVTLGNPLREKLRQLFWSEPDCNWYVAVQDRTSGEVITILYFVASIFKRVNLSTLWHAQDLARGKVLPKSQRPSTGAGAVTKPRPFQPEPIKRVLLPSEIETANKAIEKNRFFVFFENGSSGSRQVVFKKLKGEVALEKGVLDQTTRDWLAAKIEEQRAPKERCAAIFIRIGETVLPIVL